MKKKIKADISYSAILDRFLKPNSPFRTKAAARAFLTLKLSKEDKAIMKELAAKARRGRLSDDDAHAIDLYSMIGSFLSILKVKAKVTLQEEATETARKATKRTASRK
jgi:hypothetical protein